MVEMTRVTQEEYVEKLNEHKHEEYTLQLLAWQVPILHGLVALAADHPGIKNMGIHTHQTIKEVRDWCKMVFSLWGFSPEQIEFLDKMREQSTDERMTVPK